MLIAAGAKMVPAYLNYLACHPYRQCPCQGLGQKVAMINHMKRNGNHGEREKITLYLMNCSCQNFLQTVKPDCDEFSQKNPRTYLVGIFQL
jgi:hypothetical protein